MPFRLMSLALLLLSTPAIPSASTTVEVGDLAAELPAGLRHQQVRENGKNVQVATDGVSRLVSFGVVEGAALSCASPEARETGLRPGRTAGGFVSCVFSKSAAEGDRPATLVMVMVQTIAGTAVITSISSDELDAERRAHEVADSVRVSEAFERKFAQGFDRRMVGCFSRYGVADARSSSSTTLCFRSDRTYWSRTHVSFANFRGESTGALMSRPSAPDGVWSLRDGWLEQRSVDGGTSRRRIQFGERGFFLDPAPPGVEDDPDEEYWSKVEDGDVAPALEEGEPEVVGWMNAAE